MENNNNTMSDNNALNHSNISNLSGDNFDNVGKPEASKTGKDSAKSKLKKAPLRIKKNITQEEIEAQIKALMDKKAELEKERIEAEKKEREAKEKEALDTFTRDIQTLQTTLSNDSIIKAIMDAGISAEDLELSLISKIWELGDDSLKSKLLNRYKRVTSKSKIYKALKDKNNQSYGA